MSVALKHHMPHEIIDGLGIEYAIVDSARTCTAVDNGVRNIENDKKLIRYLYKNRHTTPFEMIQFVFHIRTTRAIALQICRHRTFSINMESQRYSEVREGEFEPITELRGQDPRRKQCSKSIINNPDLIDRIHDHYDASYALYKDLIDQGVAREQARFVLPESTMTSLVISVNLHNFLHFIKLRTAPDAQPEIQLIANKMLELVQHLIPTTIQLINDV